MAFYHVGGCSCPEGCCDCGVLYIYFNCWRNTLDIFAGRDGHKVKEYHDLVGEL